MCSLKVCIVYKISSNFAIRRHINFQKLEPNAKQLSEKGRRQLYSMEID
jgi:hypothetical protein